MEHIDYTALMTNYLEAIPATTVVKLKDGCHAGEIEIPVHLQLDEATRSALIEGAVSGCFSVDENGLETYRPMRKLYSIAYMLYLAYTDGLAERVDNAFTVARFAVASDFINSLLYALRKESYGLAKQLEDTIAEIDKMVQIRIDQLYKKSNTNKLVENLNSTLRLASDYIGNMDQETLKNILTQYLPEWKTQIETLLQDYEAKQN